MKFVFNPVGSGAFSWYKAGNMSSSDIYEIDDIRIYSSETIGNISVFVIGWHTIVKAGQFWLHDNSKIEGTTSSTIVSDEILFNLIKKDILDVKYFSTPNLSTLNGFEMHCRTVTGSMTIDGYKYKFPTTSQMQALLTQ